MTSKTNSKSKPSLPVRAVLGPEWHSRRIGRCVCVGSSHDNPPQLHRGQLRRRQSHNQHLDYRRNGHEESGFFHSTLQIPRSGIRPGRSSQSRIANTRWPDRETVMDASEGVQLATHAEAAPYWAKDYD